MNTFPQPSNSDVLKSKELTTLISEEIEANDNFLSFSRYMSLALYHPKLGYYQQNRPIFGSKGDFITSPEVSALFGYTLADQCKAAATSLGDYTITELGAGRGTLAADMLTRLEQTDALPSNYYIIEISTHLRECQKQTFIQRCPHLLPQVTWLDELPDEQTLTGIIIANEFFDALPFIRFKKTENGFDELGISLTDGSFCWAQRSMPTSFEPSVEHLNHLKLPIGYHSEVTIHTQEWIKRIANSLSSGIAFIIDYGYPRTEYYHPSRATGTLMCHYKHHAHDDPFFLPGIQDITTHIDFTHLAEQAVAQQMDIAGFSYQAHFLLANNIIQHLDAQQLSDTERLKLSQEVKTLTLPNEMGEKFCVLGLSKNYEQTVNGFSLRDLRHRL